MTKAAFVALCEQFTIDPLIALESPELCEALAARDDEAVERILAKEF